MNRPLVIQQKDLADCRETENHGLYQSKKMDNIHEQITHTNILYNRFEFAVISYCFV